MWFKICCIIKKCTKFAISIGLEVHAGHGLTYKSAKIISKVIGINEFNIGHFIIAQSIFIGMKRTIMNFKRILLFSGFLQVGYEGFWKKLCLEFQR